MSNDNVFYVLVSGFVLGIFLSSFFKMGFSFFLFFLILAGLIFIYGKYFSQSKTVIILMAIFIFSFGLGILRYEIKENQTRNNIIPDLVGEKIILIGLVSSEPSIKDQSVQLVVSDGLVSVSNKEIKISEKVLVSVGLFPKFKYGDQIQVQGKLERPKNFLTNTSRDFAYTDFLAKDDIFYQINFAQAEIISANQGSVLKRQLFTFKNTFVERINKVIKEPESSLLAGLLLGAKNSLGEDLQTDFRRAGVSHIIALSGYNITIVAESIILVFSFLPNFFSLSFGVLGIIFFAIMTGGSATVVRASIMALLVLLAKSTSRKYEIVRALLLAGIFMLIQNPKILVFDISFQLSFLATIALIFVSPLLEKKTIFITKKYHLRELIVATVSTQIFVLPFLFYKIGLLSVFALFTNILILPVIPLIMFLGFLTGVFCFTLPILAIPIAFVCSLLLAYVLKVIYFFSHLPFSSITIKSFPVTLMVIIYGIILVVIYRSKKVSLVSSVS
jgi:competence protein ComEC